MTDSTTVLPEGWAGPNVAGVDVVDGLKLSSWTARKWFDAAGGYVDQTVGPDGDLASACVATDAEFAARAAAVQQSARLAASGLDEDARAAQAELDGWTIGRDSAGDFAMDSDPWTAFKRDTVNVSLKAATRAELLALIAKQ